jgi:hypothetical protein
MSFQRALYELAQFAALADATRRDMRVSISFTDEGDRARFLLELKRELEPMFHDAATLTKSRGFTQVRFNGIDVRILDV